MHEVHTGTDKNVGSSDVFEAVRLRTPIFQNVTMHFWADVSQSFDKATAFTLMVRGSFLILEDKRTSFI
jgi:hypothetical protein